MTEYSKRVADMILATAAEFADKLAGLGPEAQSAILADLISRWVVGHAPGLRDEVWRMHVQLVWQLVEVNDKIMFGAAGHPAGREGYG